MKSEYKLYSIDDTVNHCVAIVRSNDLSGAIQKVINLLGFENIHDFMLNFPGNCYSTSNHFFTRMTMIGWSEHTIKEINNHPFTFMSMCLSADYFNNINDKNVESYVYSCISYPTVEEVRENDSVIVHGDSINVWYCTDWNDYFLRKGVE